MCSQKCPLESGSFGGDFFGIAAVGMCYAPGYSSPSSHLQSSSTNKPAATDTKKAKIKSNMFTPFAISSGGSRQVYYTKKMFLLSIFGEKAPPLPGGVFTYFKSVV